MDEPVDDILGEEHAIPAEIKVIKATSTSRGEEIEKMLSQTIRLNDRNMFVEPSCLICTSPYRRELEQKYLEISGQGKAVFTEIKKFAKDIHGIDLEFTDLENHFTLHVNQNIREQQKLEYSQVVKRLYNQNLTTIDRLGLSFAVLTERLMGVNSLTPSHNESVAEIEKIKSSETVRIMGVVSNLLKLQAAMLGEMKERGDLLTVPTKEFTAIFNEAILSAKTEGEKKILISLLEKLQVLSAKTQ